MKQGIVIGSHPGSRDQLDTLLASLKGTRWPVYVVMNNSHGDIELPDWLAGKFYRSAAGYELGAFKIVLDETDLDEFLFLQDSFEILDQSFIDDVFADPYSVALGPTFFHYAGKWKRSVLGTMEIPVVHSKAESVHWEHTFSRLYWEREQVRIYDPHFHDGENQGFIEAFGRLNMVLENRWYRKLKGDWGQRPL